MENSTEQHITPARVEAALYREASTAARQGHAQDVVQRIADVRWYAAQRWDAIVKEERR